MRKENAKLYEFIKENWDKKTDFHIAQAFDETTTQQKVRHIRIRLGLKRSPEMMARMYQAQRDGSVYFGRGANKVKRDHSWKVNKYNR